jgi:hypothetical protein
MKTKTAIQMLIESVEYWNIKIDCPNLYKAICDQAIELEKEQIIESYYKSFDSKNYYISGEDYYNQIFKKNKQ